MPAKIGTEIDSALALLVLGVGADDHDAAVATNHPALFTHFLDRGAHLHGVWLSKIPNSEFTTAS